MFGGLRSYDVLEKGREWKGVGKGRGATRAEQGRASEQARKKRTSVHHQVHGGSGENGAVAGRQDFCDQARAVLLVHVRGCVAQDGHDEVDGVGVPVGRDEGAGT